jgi:hypothetical protein
MTADARDVAEVAAAKQQAQTAENQRRQAAEAQVKAPPGGVIDEQPNVKLPPTRHDQYDQ